LSCLVYQYHDICHNSSSSLGSPCFFDDQYLCFCEVNNYRAECFDYDHKLDHCNWCFSNGRCVQGDLQKADDFLCLCQECHYGHRCQFNLQAFGFTLESLLADCSQIMKHIYTTITFRLVIIGLFNNICSFVTFKRPTPRKLSVGNFLFVVTCLNSLVLLVLFVKFAQITFEISDVWSCRIFSYLLSVLTRSTYWMTSWITVGRLFLILFPTSLTLINPRRAKVISLITITILLGMNGHEIIYYTSIRPLPTDSLICVTNFNIDIISTYNRVATLIHYLIPFNVQVISITVLIVLAAQSRVKTIGKKMTFCQILNKQFQMQKDLYIMPVIIILSALPQTIITFSLGCSELSTSWRHILLISHLLSYSPQLLGSILYVFPSTSYKAEFGKTSLAKKWFKCIFDKEQNDIVIRKTEKIRTNLERTK
jgi:hypothetical protein